VPARPPLLLLSATEREAAPTLEALAAVPAAVPLGRAWEGRVAAGEVVLLVAGVGKVNTAAALALALQRWQPRAVLQFGIGGAYVGSFLSVGMAALASAEVHVDCGAGHGSSWRDLRSLGFPLLEGPPPRYNEIPTDAALTGLLAERLRLPGVRFATSEQVTGDPDEAERVQRAHDVSIESMEGAAAAQVCLALGVPFAELRAVSNIVGERDRTAWDVPAAVRAVNEAVATALAEAGTIR